MKTSCREMNLTIQGILADCWPGIVASLILLAFFPSGTGELTVVPCLMKVVSLFAIVGAYVSVPARLQTLALQNPGSKAWQLVGCASHAEYWCEFGIALHFVATTIQHGVPYAIALLLYIVAVLCVANALNAHLRKRGYL